MSLRRDPGPSDALGRPSLAVGVLLALVGAVLLAAPGIADLLPANQVAVLLVAGVAGLAGLVLVMRRRREEHDAAETGDPETLLATPVPGDRLDDQLARVERLGRAPVRARNRVRTRLREAAIAVVRRRERCSTETATEQVDAGAWTDDPHAARFVGDPDRTRVSLRENLPRMLSLRSRFGFGARRTIEAVLDLAADGSDVLVEEVSPPALAPGPASGEAPVRTDRETGRWVGVGALALLAGAVGMAFTQPAVLLLSVVGVTYAAYARRSRPPTVELSVERELSTTGATPGEEVRVTVTVRNDGDELLSDLRLVDGVPSGLAVVEDSPRLGTALRPGRTATFAYTVEARRGEHAFGPLQVLARDASGAVEREQFVEAPGTLTCFPTLDGDGSVPLYGAATRYTGRVTTESGGEGVEFHATREYRPGDPPRRIDWNRHARSRELATLLFREERAATVVLLVDVRASAFRSPAPGSDHAVSRSVDAAGEVFESLLAGGDRVGIASFGPRECWLPPGAGQDHRERARRLLATDPAFAHAPPDEEFLPSARLANIRRRAPVDAQFVLLSPVTDDYIGTVARRFQAHGYPVTVVSPDVTTGGSLGRRLVRVERQTRLNALRESGVRVVDWRPDEALAVAFDRASSGWSG